MRSGCDAQLHTNSDRSLTIRLFVKHNIFWVHLHTWSTAHLVLNQQILPVTCEVQDENYWITAPIKKEVTSPLTRYPAGLQSSSWIKKQQGKLLETNFQAKLKKIKPFSDIISSFYLSFLYNYALMDFSQIRKMIQVNASQPFLHWRTKLFWRVKNKIWVHVIFHILPPAEKKRLLLEHLLFL